MILDKLSPKKIKLLNLVFLIGTFLLLLFSYLTFVGIVYRYYGFYIDYNTNRIILSSLIIIVFFVLYYIIPMTDFMLFTNSFFYLFYLFPSVIMYAFYPNYTIDILLFNLLFVLFVLILSTLKFNLKLVSYKKSSHLFMLIFLLVLPYFLINRFNFNVNIFNPLVYDPAKRHEAIEKLNLFLKYLLGWLTKVILPFILAVSISKKKYIFSFIIFMILLYFFSIYTLRAILFTAFLVVIFAFFKKISYSALFFNIAIFFSLLAAILIRIFFAHNNPSAIFPEGIISKRVIFLPQYINTLYFDFFRDNHMFLSYSKLSLNIIQYPYNLDPAHLLGYIYHDNPRLCLNNGFISVGFMDFGYWGILIYMFMYLLMIIYFNSICLHPVMIGLIINIYFTLVSSSLLTSFLSFGLFILLPLLYISPVKQCSTEYY